MKSHIAHCCMFIALLVLLTTAGMAQNVRLTEGQREQQRNFIRKDTLPVAVEALPTNINSHFSEYAGRLYPDSAFFFTSMRADVKEDYDRFFETSWYCNIYESHLRSDGSYARPTSLPAVINSRKFFNSNFCFNPQRDLLVFSRCNRAGDGDLQCALWESRREKKGWSKPQKLPSVINMEGYSSLQPFLLSYDNHSVLYFISNRPKGYGGLDIWYSISKDGKYNPPVNLGSTINTEGNEVTPFYDAETSTLYFSSDEHLGIGDYDIFYSNGALSQWGEVSNMGVPFNSAYNDFYFAPNQDEKSGFFTSNRPHDGAAPEDTCCNDIFHFRWIPKTDSVPQPVDTPTIHEKIASVLPISLYFQNDEPDPRSLSDTTTADYDQLYRRYLADHDLYVSESGQGLSGDSLTAVQQGMYAFMRDSVATGHDRMILLKNYIREALRNGETVELTVSGFASPLHNSDYNKHLSARRIVSLLNYLYKADNFALAPYLDGDKPGLVIHTDPQGAVQHTFASGETRETVYGLQAAKDRKIVISASKIH